MKAMNLLGQRFGRLVVCERSHNAKSSKTQWVCKCDCGNSTISLGNNLRRGLSESCGKCLQNEDLAGKRFGKLVATKQLPRNSHGAVMWECSCDCGSVCSHAASSLLRKQRGPKSCGCLQSRPANRVYDTYKDLSATYWKNCAIGAQRRGLEFSITQEMAWEIFESQGKRCKLTGWQLAMFPTSTSINSQTASLDRIDSTKGYVPGNIQWVHKHINMMKQHFPEEAFVEMCKAVALHNA